MVQAESAIWSHYGPTDLDGKVPFYSVMDDKGNVIAAQVDTEEHAAFIAGVGSAYADLLAALKALRALIPQAWIDNIPSPWGDAATAADNAIRKAEPSIVWPIETNPPIKVS